MKSIFRYIGRMWLMRSAIVVIISFLIGFLPITFYKYDIKESILSMIFLGGLLAIITMGLIYLELKVRKKSFFWFKMLSILLLYLIVLYWTIWLGAGVVKSTDILIHGITIILIILLIITSTTIQIYEYKQNKEKKLRVC